MDCLKGYIGVLGCTEDTPESELYINSLPGVSLEMLDKVASPDQLTFKGVWDDVETRALVRFETALNQKLSERYRLKVASVVNLEKKIDVTSLATKEAGKLRGINIDLTYGGSYLDSVFKAIHLQEVSVYSTELVDGMEIKIYDGYTGELLQTLEADLSSGWNRVAVNKRFAVRSLVIGYDASLIDGVKLQVDSYPGDHYLYGVEFEQADSLLKGDNSYGLSARYAVGCSYEALICSYRDHFKSALWYALGMELMIERRYSQRLNKFTINTKTAEDLQLHYEQEFNKLIGQAAESLNISLSDSCIECNNQITYRESRL